MVFVLIKIFRYTINFFNKISKHIIYKILYLPLVANVFPSGVIANA